MWQDLKLGAEHLTNWKRIALVTDIDWMVHLTSLFGWMTPGELKHFLLADREAAIAQAAAGDSIAPEHAEKQAPATRPVSDRRVTKPCLTCETGAGSARRDDREAGAGEHRSALPEADAPWSGPPTRTKYKRSRWPNGSPRTHGLQQARPRTPSRTRPALLLPSLPSPPPTGATSLVGGLGPAAL